MSCRVFSVASFTQDAPSLFDSKNLREGVRVKLIGDYNGLRFLRARKKSSAVFGLELSQAANLEAAPETFRDKVRPYYVLARQVQEMTWQLWDRAIRVSQLYMGVDGAVWSRATLVDGRFRQCFKESYLIYLGHSNGELLSTSVWRTPFDSLSELNLWVDQLTSTDPRHRSPFDTSRLEKLSVGFTIRYCSLKEFFGESRRANSWIGEDHSYLLGDSIQGNSSAAS